MDKRDIPQIDNDQNKSDFDRLSAYAVRTGVVKADNTGDKEDSRS